jgi:hypothetical protein
VTFHSFNPHEELIFPPKFSSKHELSSHYSPSKLKGSSYPIPIFTIDYQKKRFDYDPIYTKIQKKLYCESKKTYSCTTSKRQFDRLPEGYVTSDFKDFIVHDKFAPDIITNPVHNSYDWRHHGGNLSSKNISKEFHLIQSDDQLPLRLIDPDKFDSITKSWDQESMESDYVYEICKYKDLFGLRKRKSVKIVNILDQFDVITFESKHDILSCTLQKSDLYYIDSTNRIKQFNIVSEIGMKLESSKLEGLTPMLKSFDKEIFSLTDSHKLYLVDIRGNITQTIFLQKNLSTGCDEIFNHMKSTVNENYIYIGSTHLLYLCDIRVSGKPISQSYHQLFRPPLMMKSVKSIDNNEVICLSSNHPQDIKLFNFVHKEQRMDALPIYPKSMHKSLNELHTKGKLLLEDDLKKRIRMSVSGIELKYSKKDEIELFIQTSIGDIFKSHIFLTQEFDEKCENFEMH